MSGAKWDQNLADPIHTWVDPEDGKEYVVNGHHRYALAKAAGAETIEVSQIPNDKFPTAESARKFGALKNIADGNGTSVDAAKFLRDEGYTAEEVKKLGLPLKKTVLTEGLALSRLSDGMFDQVIDGRLDPKRAAAIGEATDVPAEQESIMSGVRKAEKAGRNITPDEIREMARLAKSAPTTTQTSASLFGEEELTKNLLMETAEVSDYIKKQIAQQKRDFGSVADKGKAARLESAGNKIDHEKNAAESKGAAQRGELYDKLSARTGPLQDVLHDAAKDLADGGNATDVKQRAYERARDVIDKFFH